MPKKEVINTEPGALVSPAVRFGNLVFTSGMVGRDAAGNLPSGIREQTKLALDRIRATLGAAGSSMDSVVKVVAFLANLEDKAAFNEVYGSYFTAHPPARTCVESGGLGDGILVEIECIACLPQ